LITTSYNNTYEYIISIRFTLLIGNSVKLFSNNIYFIPIYKKILQFYYYYKAVEKEMVIFAMSMIFVLRQAESHESMSPQLLYFLCQLKHINDRAAYNIHHIISNRYNVMALMRSAQSL